MTPYVCKEGYLVPSCGAPIVTMLAFCLKTHISSFKVSIISRSMGSHGISISATVANLFMEEFEIKAINSAPIHPSFELGMWMTPLSSKRQKTAPIPTINQLCWPTHSVHSGYC